VAAVAAVASRRRYRRRLIDEDDDTTDGTDRTERRGIVEAPSAQLNTCARSWI
jgi:hypothetical protein